MGEMIVYVEKRDGKRNVGFYEGEREKRLFGVVEGKRMGVNGLRGECGWWWKEIVSEIEKDWREL